MKLMPLVLLLATVSFAGEHRVGPLQVLTIQTQNYGLPGIPEPPFRADWYQVIVHTDTPGIVAFRVTLRFIEGSESKTSTLAAPLLGGQKYAWLMFPGKPTKVLGITVEELRAEPAIEITP